MNSPVELIGNGPKVAFVAVVTTISIITCEVSSPYVVTPQPEP